MGNGGNDERRWETVAAMDNAGNGAQRWATMETMGDGGATMGNGAQRMGAVPNKVTQPPEPLAVVVGCLGCPGRSVGGRLPPGWENLAPHLHV